MLLDAVRGTGATVVPVELVVGLGTFRPIATNRVEDHHMHGERYRVPEASMEACRAATRVVAVGTTTVRALESAAATGELSGRTELFIHGDRPFELVGALLTNFHQPRSSLLVLVDAFVGPRWRALYEEALARGYRFLSFGDAMFLRGERG
jgi:S-adenosylmethionine:tRNA ribosyltransferase-isomerase